MVTHVYMEFKSQWIVVSVSVRRAGLVSAAILSAQDMVISVLPQADVDARTILVGREKFVTYQDVQACLDVTAVEEVCLFSNCLFFMFLL